MPAKALAGWLGYFRVEPTGEHAATVRTARLAQLTSEIRGVAVEDIDPCLPTRKVREEMDEYERGKAEFEGWLGSGRGEK